MKVDIIKKFKWYIVGFILVAIMLSVSLSFCTWDSLSLQAKMSTSMSGGFEVWSNYIKDANGNKLTSAPTVGQVVKYGNFYQASGATTTSAQRWIVVDYNTTTKVATLLTEQVVVYGNFWGNGQYYQNYYQSTVRSWLNSGKGSLKGSGTTWKDNERYADNVRNDNVGSEFSGGATQVNKGFLDVAFTTDEKSILIPKNITGMSGYAKNVNSGFDTYKTTDNRTEINDLVWLPSWQEIYGTKENPWSGITLNDGTPNTKFSHFDDVKVYGSGESPKRNWVSAKAVSGASAYAINAASSSYFNNGGGSTNGSTPAKATWWWLRSPTPSNCFYALIVNTDGSGADANTYHSFGGVRPAVCVQL